MQSSDPKIDQILLPHFDTEYSAKLVLGKYWNAASADQRTRFVSVSVHPVLPGLESPQLELPFQTIIQNQATYKIFGLVTNRTLDGNELITWHRERCGDSEKVHCIESRSGRGAIPLV